MVLGPIHCPWFYHNPQKPKQPASLRRLCQEAFGDARFGTHSQLTLTLQLMAPENISLPRPTVAVRRRASGAAARRGRRGAGRFRAPISPRYMWTARLRSRPSKMAACASSSDSQLSRRAARIVAVGRRGFDCFALASKLLAGLPHRLERIDQPQDRAVAFDERPPGARNDLVQGGKRRLSLVEPAL